MCHTSLKHIILGGLIAEWDRVNQYDEYNSKPLNKLLFDNPL